MKDDKIPGKFECNCWAKCLVITQNKTSAVNWLTTYPLAKSKIFKGKLVPDTHT